MFLVGDKTRIETELHKFPDAHIDIAATRASVNTTMISISTHVDTLAPNAAASAGWNMVGVSRAVRAMTAVVAEADTNPPATPLITKPRLGPNTRVPT